MGRGFGGSTFTTSSLKDTWNHIALSFVSSSTLEASFYVNGNLHETKTNTVIAALGEITGSLKGRMGAGRIPQEVRNFWRDAYTNMLANGHSPFKGSIDGSDTGRRRELTKITKITLDMLTAAQTQI